MGALVGGIIGIISAIVGAVATIVSAVAAALSAIGAALAAIGTFVYSSLVGIIAGVVEGLGLVSTATVTNMLVTAGVTDGIGTTLYYYVGTAIEAFVSYVSTFLEVIHFKTLMAINNIAYLVSSDYRVMMQGVYNNIAKYSSELNMGTGFVLLALQNSRTFVLDASTMLGRSYDLGQVSYLKELESYLGELSSVGKKYKNNPGMLLLDLEERIVRPNVETKTEVMRFFYSTLDNISKIADSLVTNVDTLRQDIVNIVNDLPDKLKGDWAQDILDADKKLRDFIRDEYSPVLSSINTLVDRHANTLESHANSINAVVQRLAHPGDYIAELRNKGDDVRRRQVSTINDVLWQDTTASVAATASNDNTVANSLASINDALQAEIPSPSWEYVEQQGAIFSPGEQQASSKTWYQGDY